MNISISQLEKIDLVNSKKLQNRRDNTETKFDNYLDMLTLKEY